jgi:hypothetical protein
MSSELTVLYLGSDASYWATIKQRLEGQFASYAFEFHELYSETEEGIQSLIIDIINIKPKLIYIDYSKQTEDFLHLARLIKRLNPTRDIATIGLLDQNDADVVSKYSQVAGVTCNHIKSGEYHDIVYGGINLADPVAKEELQFAMGQMNEKYMAHETVKVGYVTEKTMHIENLRALTEGTIYQANHHFNQNKIVKGKNIKVLKSGTEDLYYTKEYFHDLEIQYTNPVEKDPDASEALMKEREAERVGEEEFYSKKMKAWVQDNLERSSPKQIKVLVIDKNLTCYNNESRTDRYNYVFRVQPYLKEPSEEFKSYSPHILAFQFEGRRKKVELGDKTEDQLKEEAGEEVKKEKKDLEIATNHMNDENALKQIIQEAKHMNNHPFILLFGTKVADSKTLQEKYQYENLIAQTGDLEMPILIKLADTLEKKWADTIQSHSHWVVFKKDNHQSFMELSYPINIVNICESEVHFTCDENLPFGTTIRLEEPSAFHLTVIKPNEASIQVVGKAGYRALVTMLGEEGKKNIRQVVNSIFFRDLEAQKAAEKEEYEKVQQAAKRRKEEEAKKQKEIEEKKKKQEEEQKKKEEEAKKAAAEAANKTENAEDNGEQKDENPSEESENEK